MTFGDAIKMGFENYVNFDGRASRAAYWWWFLFAFLAGIAANILGAALDTSILSILVGLGLFLPGLAFAVRRLHDTGRSGWWVLIALIPLIGFIVLIVFLVGEGDDGPNEYGPPPVDPAPATV